MTEKTNLHYSLNDQFTWSVLKSLEVFLFSFLFFHLLFFVVGLFWFSSFSKSVAFFLCSFTLCLHFSSRSCFFFSDSFLIFLMCWILLSVSNLLLVSLLFISRFLDHLGLNSGSKSCRVGMNWPSVPNTHICCIAIHIYKYKRKHNQI